MLTKTPVICQKPMANDFAEAKAMVRLCQEAQVPFFVHENWRWQRPIRELKKVLDSGKIGPPFRARIDFNTSFPVFTNQPFLRELEAIDSGGSRHSPSGCGPFFIRRSKATGLSDSNNQSRHRRGGCGHRSFRNAKRDDGHLQPELRQSNGNGTVSRRPSSSSRQQAVRSNWLQISAFG